ncbi:glycoside hydrolase superfamily [Xylaria sp. FL1042]|nr:glycoside hydrolase superfamily [Xylaria sp. FL1042]
MRSISAFSISLLGLHLASATYDPSRSDNVATYWGQNSLGGANTQRPLIEVCESELNVDIINMAFLTSLSDIEGGLNFANSYRPTEREIIACQTQYNKTIILSLGGAVLGNTVALENEGSAYEISRRIWDSFGPSSISKPWVARPFGSASVDGFDLDIEVPYPNIHLVARGLRSLMNSETAVSGRKFYLSAAPQCPFPDLNLNSILQGHTATALDFVFIQFYNNAGCDVRSPNGFWKSLENWSMWANATGARAFVGLPGGVTAISEENRASYVEGSVFAANYVNKAKEFFGFAGIGVWDMSQLDSNPTFLPSIAGALGKPGIAVSGN